MTFQSLDRMLGDHAPFLLSLEDGRQESLRLVIAAAETGPAGSAVPDLEDMDAGTREKLRDILANTRPIMADGQRYEITFPCYILYQVRDESFFAMDPEEIRRGRYLITFEKSRLLDQVCTVTDAQQFEDGTCYPGLWQHYGIYTQNHVIDVISHCPPEVSALE